MSYFGIDSQSTLLASCLSFSILTEIFCYKALNLKGFIKWGKIKIAQVKCNYILGFFCFLISDQSVVFLLLNDLPGIDVTVSYVSSILFSFLPFWKPVFKLDP